MKNKPRLVALDLPGGPEFIEALIKIWDDGDVALPVDQRLPAAARTALFTRLRPAVLLQSGGAIQALAQAVPMETGDALVVATSGTTGNPKGVILTHQAVDASATITSDAIGATARDRWYACLPPAHIGGLSVITRAIRKGIPITAVPTITPTGLAAAAASGHTLVSLVVAALPRIEAERWRKILLGGSAIPAAIPPNAVRTYGMTETGSGIVYDGYSLPGVELKITDGQILVRSPTLARGYRDCAVDAAAIALPMSDGWFLTGDSGSLGTDGLLRVTGRIGDVIVSGGEKIWPEPVERALMDLKVVADVAVTGVPDVAWGQAVVAIVVPADPSNPPSLDVCRAAVKTSLPTYCAPTRLAVVRAIPRTNIGKIRRAALPQLFRDNEAG